MINENTTQAVDTSNGSEPNIPLETVSQWQNYIAGDVDPKMYSYHQKARFDLAKYMHQKQHEGRSLFHLTLTYKPYSGRDYLERDVNTFFINFYTKKFLPYVMRTKNYHTNVKKAIQPICYCFIDEHSMITKEELVPNYTKMEWDFQCIFAERLHHHAILAVHPETLPIIQSLVGLNTFANDDFSTKIMTSDLKQCEPMRILYSSKMYWKYQDFMTFPNSFKRHRRTA